LTNTVGNIWIFCYTAMMVVDLAEYYENFVKEYLELQGFFVMQNVKFKKENESGRKAISDIDIIAINPCMHTCSDKCVLDPIIVGEVKASVSFTNKNQVDDEIKDFNNKKLEAKVKEILGDDNYSRYIFCWDANEETRKYAEKDLKDKPIKIREFWEIIEYLIDKTIEKTKNEAGKRKYLYEPEHPNLMLLQMLHHFSKKYKGRTRLDLDKLKVHDES
jgi:hypothetical protein